MQQRKDAVTASSSQRFVDILLMRKVLPTKLIRWPSCLMGVLQVH